MKNIQKLTKQACKCSILSVGLMFVTTFAFAQDLTKFTDKKGKVGFNEGKKKVIEAKYDDATNFDSKVGLAGVKSGEKWGLIDKSGKEIVPFEYDKIETEYDGIKIKVKKDGKFGMIDRSGKLVIPLKYDGIGVAPSTNSKGATDFFVKLDGKFGLMSSEGKELTPIKYTFISLKGVNPNVYFAKIGSEEFSVSETGEELGGSTTSASSSASSSSSSNNSSAKKDECTYKCNACNKVVTYKCHATPGDTCPVLTQKEASGGGGKKGHEWRKQK